MQDIETLNGNLTEVSEVKLPGGWRGVVAVRAGESGQFSKSIWEKLLSEPAKLLEGTKEKLKVEGENSVSVKILDAGGNEIKAVIKRRQRSGILGMLRSIGTAHSIRNFNTTIEIREYGLPVSAPLAGVYHRRFFFCDESIYISEYIEGTNVYEFLKGVQAQGAERYRMMRQLSAKTSEIFAMLHKNNLWHRDAKATNFIVNKDEDGEYQITIIDVDGIKRYLSQSEERQLQGLVHLAASVLALPGISRTDYLRTFEMYCDEVMIPQERRRDIFIRLADKAKAKYLSKQAQQGR